MQQSSLMADVYNDDYTATGYSDPKTVEGITIWSDLEKKDILQHFSR